MRHCVATAMGTPYLAHRMHDFLRRHLRPTSEFMTNYDGRPQVELVLGYYLCNDEGNTKVGFNFDNRGMWGRHVCRWMAVVGGRQHYCKKRGESRIYTRTNGQQTTYLRVHNEWVDEDPERIPTLTTVNEVGYRPFNSIVQNYHEFGVLTEADANKAIAEFLHEGIVPELPVYTDVPGYYERLLAHRRHATRCEDFHAELQRLNRLWEQR